MKSWQVPEAEVDERDRLIAELGFQTMQAGGKEGRLTRYVPGPRFDSHGPVAGYEAELEALAASESEAA